MKPSAAGSTRISSTRGIESPPQCDDGTERPLGEEQAHGASQKCHDHALRHELAQHVGSTRTECKTRCDLLPAAGKARQQQVRNVRASDQQDAADRAEQHQVALTLVPHGIVEQRHHLDF